MPKNPNERLPISFLKTAKTSHSHSKKFSSQHQAMLSLSLPKPADKSQPILRRSLSRRLSFHSFDVPVEHGGDANFREKVLAMWRALFRLWCHESARVYADRLTSNRDKVWFSKVLDLCVRYCFCGATIQTDSSEREISESATFPVQDVRGRVRPGARPKPRITRVTTTGSTSCSSDLAVVTIFVEELKACHVNKELLLSLLPKNSQVQFIPYDQVVMRGEDLSCLMFAKLPAKEEGELESKSLQESEPSRSTLRQNDRNIHASHAASDDQSTSDTGTSEDGCELAKRTFE